MLVGDVAWLGPIDTPFARLGNSRVVDDSHCASVFWGRRGGHG
jgi:hypothetical protein